ncbi:MAG: dihydrolipoamide acetyltransferase family protein [Polyangiaceae bacterium]
MSRFEFKLPDIGEGVTEGEIVSWLIKVGDELAEDQDMVEVMTDKATVTIGAPKAGVVVQLGGKEGDVVAVGSVLVVLDLAVGEGTSKSGNGVQPVAEAATAEPAATAVGDIKESLPGMGARPARAAAARPAAAAGHFTEKPLAAPATRKLARELGVDLRQVPPTGPAERVTREDVERFARGAATMSVPGAERSPGAQRSSPTTTMAPEPTPVPEARRAPPVAVAVGDQRIPIRGIRRRIFENMARSKHTAAHFTYVDECDVTQLRALRERTRSIAEREGLKLTFLPFIVKAVVAALRVHPTLNCVVDEAAQEMVLKSHYDIGIAAATDAGLTVPVLRHVEQMSILDIARELDRLGEDARAGKLRMEDLGGSGFTITSLGKLGGLFATPIVNYPEVAILGVHEMKKRPVVKGDQIVIGEVMLLSLSFDHRLIDGHVGAAFARTLIEFLEEPDRLLVSMS